LTNRIIRYICAILISIARRGVVPSPDILEIIHYAICPRCNDDIEAQGWRVEFKHKKKKIYEVTFKATETLQSECFEDKEEEDEEDEDEEFKVRRPNRLIVGEEKPKTPEADFYV